MKKYVIVGILVLALLILSFCLYKYKNMNTRYVKIGAKEDFDTSTERTFTKTYGKGLFARKQKIVVKDLTAPQIKLNGEETVYLCPGSKYEDEGVEVKDNFDKNPSLKTKVYDDKIIYTALDKNNNKKELTRFIKYQDKEAPVIEGSEMQALTKGTKPHFTVKDNCDKELSYDLKNFDANKVGKQVIEVVATDKAGNKATKEVTVYVSEPGAVKTGVIYLTFDDGPGTSTTRELLDKLKKHNIKASFFVTGRGDRSLIKRACSEGHQMGIHTFSHDYRLVYQSMNSFYDDFNKVDKIIYDECGFHTKYYRFPGGSSNTVSRRYTKGIVTQIAKELTAKGYHYYDWNISSGDATGGKRIRENLSRNVINGLRKDRPNVVLYHDIYQESVDSVDAVIEYAKNHGYIFDKLNPSIVSHHKIAN